MGKFSAALARIRAVVAGEPVRVVIYGAAVAILIVANSSPRIPDITFDEALLAAGSAVVFLTEMLRHLVTPVSKLDEAIE